MEQVVDVGTWDRDSTKGHSCRYFIRSRESRMLGRLSPVPLSPLSIPVGEVEIQPKGTWDFIH